MNTHKSAKFVSNPYLWRVKALRPVRRYAQSTTKRERVRWFRQAFQLWFMDIREFSFAIPNLAALKTIARYTGKVVEIGANNGYWKMMLEQVGVRVSAYDLYRTVDYWSRVRRGSVETLSKHSNHTLLLCCPPVEDDLAYRCLRAYRGEYLLYVGSTWNYIIPERGCTWNCGDENFHKLLKKEWSIKEEVLLPNWPGFNIKLYVYERKRAHQSK
jgi:hypothetical protein